MGNKPTKTVSTSLPKSNDQSINKQPLHKIVHKALEHYFSQLSGITTANLYNMVIAEIEIPLFKTALCYTQLNQSKSAAMLGLSRGTLRKKLRAHGLDLWLKDQKN